MKEFFEKQTSEELIFKGRILTLYRYGIELPNGHKSIREVVRHPGAVCVVPVTDEGEVIMVRQFRFPFGCALLEAPAGKMDPGEEPLTSAIRELSEETGAEAAHIEYMGAYYSSVAIFDEVIHMYLATGLTFKEQHTDDDEFLELVRIPLSELVRMVEDGEIKDGKTQTALLKAWLRLKK